MDPTSRLQVRQKAIVPGRARDSRLPRLVRHEDEPPMPHKGDKPPDARSSLLEG